MWKLTPLVAAFVLVLCSPASASATHDHQASVNEQAKATWRAGVAAKRAETWRYQDAAHVQRWPTRYLERHAAISFLHHLSRLWHERTIAAKRLAKLAASRPYVDGCLRRLIDREGGWNPMKWNGGYVGVWDGGTHGGSGAYGAPQALPGSKMSSAGPDWATNIWTQIKWMIGYVRKYGGSCGAEAFQRSHGWY